MCKFLPTLVLFALLSIILISGCSSTQATTNQNLITDEGWVLPDEYAKLNNPLSNTQEDLTTGESLYLSNCKSCHGETGKGDGIAGASLNPPPPDFSDKTRQEKLSDSYYYWRIVAGGNFEPFNSAMPGWKAIFSEREIWQIIVYFRSLAN